MPDWFQLFLTNGLTAIVAFIFSNYLQSRSRKFEAEKQYREEIRKHMDDIIKPLFTHLLRLQRHLVIINEGIRARVNIPYNLMHMREFSFMDYARVM